jgi:predicted RNA-binding protein with PUA-like domain
LQARNHMRAMRKGDLAFFYHSNCPVPGVAGVMRIVGEHTVDESAFNPKHPYFDAKSDRANPKWEVVHVEFVKKFDNFVGLKELRQYATNNGALSDLQTLKQSRLSVSSVSPEEWRFILELAGESTALGHGDVGMGGYESEIDGEGEETTAAVSDVDGVNSGLEEEDGGVAVEDETLPVITSDLLNGDVDGLEGVDGDGGELDFDD